MKPFVIGVSSKLDQTSAVALDLTGQLLGKVQGKSCSYVTVGKSIAQRRAREIIDKLLQTFGGDREQCQCLLTGAAGIDSPKTKQLVTECFAAAHMLCPVLCLNDGNVALYTTTRGCGIVAVSGRGSIVVGRNENGEFARSGGYPISVRGDEGSAQWIALEAMHMATRWLDGSAERSALIARMDQYFSGLNIEKMIECARALRRQPIDTAIAQLVIDTAQEGDSAAAKILRDGAAALFEVAQTCVHKLGFSQQDAFLSGVWGDVFMQSEIYRAAYAELFRTHYPRSRIVQPEEQDARSSAEMALDYLKGNIPYIAGLQ